MEQPSAANTVDAGGRLKSDFLDGLADSLGVPEAKRRSFIEDVQKAATEFRAGRTAPKVGAIRKEITSLAKAIAKVLTKPSQTKRESLRARLDHLSPEAINFLLQHRPPHDRDTPPWGLSEPTTESLEALYALCCVGTRLKNRSGDFLQEADIRYGPVKKSGRPQDHAKMILVIRMGAAFYTAKGTYPERADIVLMADYVLEELGELAKLDRDYQDTHMAREYLRLLKESPDIVVSSRSNAARRKSARDRLTRMREKLLPVFEAELVGKKCLRVGQDWCEATAVTYEPITNAFYVHYRLGAEVLPPSFTRAAVEKLYG